jgi:hypothetical protein
MVADGGRPLAEIETWIFDLDNTLYPASCRLFDQIHARMTRFIAERLDLSPEAALALQKTYFREHGTTLRGLMTVDRIDPNEFLTFVHEVDLACVPADPVLVEALAALPGRKIVHTPRRAIARSSRHCGLVLRHRRHRGGGFRAKAGARRLSRATAAPSSAARDRTDGRRHREEPRAGCGPRHDHGLGPQFGRLGGRRMRKRAHPLRRR